MRLDKLLANLGYGSRSDIKKMIKSGQVMVDGQVCKKPEFALKEEGDRILNQVIYAGNLLNYKKYSYLMMNKPAGVVSALRDSKEKTAYSLIDNPVKDLGIVGRLDKDTRGLLLFTNDGNLAHKLLSPRKHVEKEYLFTCKNPLNQEDIRAYEEGVVIKDHAKGEVDYKTKPAKLTILDDYTGRLVITEGKYHQVKRMFAARDNQVLSLKRIRMGGLFLDESLKEGDYRELSDEELLLLQQ